MNRNRITKLDGSLHFLRSLDQKYGTQYTASYKEIPIRKQIFKRYEPFFRRSRILRAGLGEEGNYQLLKTKL